MKKSNNKRGFFITIEGGDGVGKTTHCDLLSESLRKADFEVVNVREPGGTLIGEQIREIVKNNYTPSAITELLLFEAARSELIHKVITPAIYNKKIIIADRFMDSTVAYQGYGRGIPLDNINIINKISTNNITPDLSILLNSPVSISLERSIIRDSIKDNNGTRFENEPIEFHNKVNKGFLKIAESNLDRWKIINSNREISIVAEDIFNSVISVLDIKN
tara:strand:- start:7059 stop:7715 length:657 start_codon:yes stop_codon:yes gene_type:complete